MKIAHNDLKVKLNNVFISESRENKRIVVSKDLGTWVVLDEKTLNALKAIDK